MFIIIFFNSAKIFIKKKLVEIIKQYNPEYQVVLLSNKYNILKNNSLYPKVLKLQGDNGSINHAIGKSGEWIFDSNVSKTRFF